MRLRSGIALWSGVAALALSASSLFAQSYPLKPVRLIVPLPPGGISDNIARVLAARLSDAARQPFIVENRSGANGVLGVELAAKAPPDGYTLLMGGSGPLSILPNLAARLPYDPLKDFAPVALVGIWPNLLVVHPSVPASTLRELIALARAKPGSLSYASQGNGSTGHIAAEKFKQLAGLDIVHIPYKGAAPAAQDVIGGQVPMMFDTVMVSMPHVRAGKLRALALTAAQRSPGAPGVPTMTEAGLPGLEIGAWFGPVAPAGTPRSIVDWLNRETRRVFSDPAERDRLTAQGAIMALGSPEDYALHIAQELDRWGRMIREAGIRGE